MKDQELSVKGTQLMVQQIPLPGLSCIAIYLTKALNIDGIRGFSLAAPGLVYMTLSTIFNACNASGAIFLGLCVAITSGIPIQRSTTSDRHWLGRLIYYLTWSTGYFFSFSNKSKPRFSDAHHYTVSPLRSFWSRKLVPTVLFNGIVNVSDWTY